MRLLLAAIGRLKAGPDQFLYERYADRLTASGRSQGLGPLHLRELAESRAATAALRQIDEGQRLASATRDAGHRIVLDERGTAMTSDAFALYLGRQRDAGVATLALLLGGPDGHAQSLRDGADLLLALGRMTVPHGLARIILAEQLYRATTILAGHPYHRA